MGKQTAPVLLGFLAVHVATVLDIVGIVEPFWLVGKHNGTEVANETYPQPHKGLWQYCWDDGNCTSISAAPGNYTCKAAETAEAILAVGGTGLVIFVLFMAYAFFFFGQCNKNSKLNGLMVFFLLFSVAALLTTIIIFGVKHEEDATEFGPEYILEYGYAFYLIIAGFCVTFLAMLFTCRVSCLMSEDREGYESI